LTDLLAHTEQWLKVCAGTPVRHDIDEERESMNAQELRGVIPAIPTPFTDDGEVNESGLRKLTDYVIEGGVHGIMTCGGTGEFPHLSREEKRFVTSVVADQAGGRVPVIAGTAACSTREAILLSQEAKEAGAAAVIVTAPYYFILPQEALFDHYEAIAGAAGLPVVLYNNPTYTGNDMSPQLIARLASTPGIIGMKQSNADMGQLVEAVRLVGSDFAVLTGIDSQFYPALCVGGVGIFSTAASVVPRQMVDLYNAFVDGRQADARELHMRLQGLNRFLEYDPGYVAPCKEALALMGLPAGPVRKPLPELSDSEREGIRQALVELDLL
jgi:4-hydroxy-tetrahydrodipicolinate synthase